MSKSIRGTTKKKRGRPPTTGKGTQIGMRWQELELSAIDEWREAHSVETRPEAIRRLVEIGLTVDKPQAQTPKRISAKAKRLAGQAIAGLTDQQASSAEQAERKSDLLSGPEEFRGVRIDHRKKG